MKIKKADPSKRQKLFLIIAISALVIGGAVLVYVFALKGGQGSSTKNGSSQSSNSTTKSPDTTPSSNSDNVTDTKSPDTDSNTSPANDVGVVVVDASQYSSVFEVRAYANALENGTCTYNFTRDSSNFTRETSATAGSSTTSCATLDIPTSDFADKGKWTMTITYRSQSGNYSGSITTSIEVT